MPRSILSVVLALALLVGFTTLAKADVQGSFDIHITLSPDGTQTEAVKFDIDFQSNLVVLVTLSGLTFGADIGFGVTGLEFAILSLDTNLGALAINDQFAFATPFGCADINAYSFEQCAGIDVFPLSDQVGFVKKRIQMELNIAGITLTNLALFEDVDFPDIQADDGPNDFGLGSDFPWTHEHDHWGPGETYFVGDLDNEVDNQTPTFGFGDVITLSGQTVSGITVTGSTAICAGRNNYIKKRSWTYEVNKACTASVGNILDPDAIEEDANGVGQKTPLLFEEETLSIEGVEIGGVTIDVYTEWHPNDVNGFTTDIVASFSVLDLADVAVTLSSNNITNLTLDEIAIVVSTGNLSLLLQDFDGDLELDRITAVLSVVLNPNQNAADLLVAIRTVPGTGVTRATFSLGISRGSLSLDTTTVFSGSGTLSWRGTTFSLSVDMGNGFSFGADFEYTSSGMGETSITMGIVF